jgi:hypothetical protein
MVRASMVYAPVGFAAILAVVCLFVAALLVTAKMVEAIDREQTPDLRASWAEVVPRWRGVLIFSVKFLVACGASLAATAFPAYLLLGAVRHREIATSAIFLNLGTLTIVCCLVLLLVPAAVRLLQVEQKSNMPVSLRGQAVVFAAVATEAGLLLGMFAQKLEAGIVLDHRWELTILELDCGECARCAVFHCTGLACVGNERKHSRTVRFLSASSGFSR